MTPSPRVAVLILNYNNAADTFSCIESALKSDYPGLEIVLIDNASQETGWRAVRERYPSVRVIENPENLGYAGGNNAGLRDVFGRGCEYALVLNNDAVLTPTAVSRLVAYASSDRSATLCAPKVCRWDDPDIIDSVGTEMDWLRLRPKAGQWGRRDGAELTGAREAVIFPGSAVLMSRRLWDSVGGFDESFFLIHEDADLCLRNRKAGFKNVVVRDAVVLHKVSSTLSRYPRLSAYYSARNFLALAARHASGSQRVLTACGLLFLTIKNSILFWSSSDYDKKKRLGFFGGVRDFWGGRMGKAVISE